jgi:phage protein U
MTIYDSSQYCVTSFGYLYEIFFQVLSKRIETQVSKQYFTHGLDIFDIKSVAYPQQFGSTSSVLRASEALKNEELRADDAFS